MGMAMGDAMISRVDHPDQVELLLFSEEAGKTLLQDSMDL